MLNLVVSLVILILAVALVRRLLGIERGRWGVPLPAVVVAESCAVLVFKVTAGRINDLPPRAAFGGYALVTVFTMLIVVLVELVAGRGGRRRRHHIPRPIGGTRRLVGRTVRYVRVSTMAVRHGSCIPVGTRWRSGAPGWDTRSARRSKMRAVCS
jgi:ubiquinone biosynthesis protein